MTKIRDPVFARFIFIHTVPKTFSTVYLPSRRLSENEIVFSRSRKAKIITTGIH